jgi:ADP-dependent phosphofructokinase/glucokinase
VQRLLCDFNEDLDAVKEFYNENYEEICENLFPEDLLKMPEVINGFYLNREAGGPAFDKSTIKLIFSFKKNSAFSFVSNVRK